LFIQGFYIIDSREFERMTIIKVSNLLILSNFAIVTHAWSGPDKSVNDAANRATAMKMDENKGLVQKKRK